MLLYLRGRTDEGNDPPCFCGRALCVSRDTLAREPKHALSPKLTFAIMPCCEMAGATTEVTALDRGAVALLVPMSVAGIALGGGGGGGGGGWE